MKWGWVVVLGLWSLSLNAQQKAPYFLIYDEDQSAITNGENLLTLHRILSNAEDELFAPTYFNEKVATGKFLGVSYRLGKTIFLDMQVDILTWLLQHEIFGHGYRFRQFGFTDNSYYISPFWPYGTGSGFARSGENLQNRALGRHEEIMIFKGGMGASMVMSQQLKEKWLINGHINYRETLLYNTLFLDVTIYALTAANQSLLSPGSNDILNYIRTTNAAYGFPASNVQLSQETLKKRSYLNFANTYNAFALYAFFKTYLWDGETEFAYPMIPLGNIRWLPAVRFDLTPFGSEIIVENAFVRSGELLEVNVHIGDGVLDQFYGVGAFWRKPINAKSNVSLRLDAWNQPAMELGGDRIYRTKEGIGGRALVQYDFYLRTKIPFGGFLQMAYKTDGYTAGERLDDGFIFRFGAALKLNDATPDISSKN